MFEKYTDINGNPVAQDDPGAIFWLHLQIKRRNIRRRVSEAVQTGELLRPATCSRCGAGDVKIQGHHHDYTRVLDVEWVCIPCHQKIHRA